MGPNFDNNNKFRQVKGFIPQAKKYKTKKQLPKNDLIY